MITLKKFAFAIVDAFHLVKDKNLHWQQINIEQLQDLKRAKVFAEKNLQTELKKRSVQLEHELSLLKTKNDAELAMLKTKCQQDVKDYKQYLESLDQLKHSIQSSYTHLPEAVAFTIHHHAKHLLNQMWEAENFEQKMHHEIQLINFMTTVHEDARLYLTGENTEKLPEKTLDLIDRSLG